MPEVELQALTAKDKITILLSEYSTLRAEIIARTTQGFQLLAVSGALLIWVSARQIDIRFWVVCSVGTVVVACASFFTIRDTKKAATRLCELEKDINNRAGEELLVWETVWGGANTGFWGLAKPLRRTDRLAKKMYSLTHLLIRHQW